MSFCHNTRYQSIQDKFSPKAELVKTELDQAINHFEQCQVICMHYCYFWDIATQDTYATDLFSFLSRERELADILHKVNNSYQECYYIWYSDDNSPDYSSQRNT